jgi:hypothetical protein
VTWHVRPGNQQLLTQGNNMGEYHWESFLTGAFAFQGLLFLLHSIIQWVLHA